MVGVPFGFVAFTILIVGMSAFAVFGDPGQRQLAKRARRVMGEASHKRPDVGMPRLRLASQGGLDAIIHRLIPRPDALKTRLAATGGKLTIGGYGLISIGVALIVPVVLMLRGLSIVPAVLLGVLSGLALPHMYVGRLIKRRRAKFTKLFPEAIGLMVRGLKAGLPITETMIVVGREVADPVGEEFRRVSDQVRLGQAVEDALWAAGKRLDSAEFNFLVITLSVQRETGGNLAETLENLDEILRKRQQMRMKVKAMSSEAVASAGIIGSLPFVMSGMMFLVSRGYIMTLFTSDLGLMMLAGGGTSLLIGMAVMAKMVSFDI
jgi:tight adherence protein B